MTENSLFIIRPYKHSGMWVFDDPAVGLVREPFVSSVVATHAVAGVAGEAGEWRPGLPRFYGVRYGATKTIW